MNDDNKDGGGVPPVHILRERVGKGEGEGGVREVVKVDVFERYEDLEKTVFALYNKRRDEYLLHFHFESHDRCEVKLKDSHWNKGTYFRSDLLSDGALRLIPHFVPLAPRPEGAKKRVFDAMETAVTTCSPQKKRVKTVKTPVLPTITEDAEEPALDTDMEEIDPPALNEIIESIEDDDLARGYATEELKLWPHKISKKQRAPIKDTSNYGPKEHGKFAPKTATTRLPADLTYATWRADHEAAKQKYINDHLNGIPPPPRGARGFVSGIAHRELIAGKYGMTAVDPCSNCVKAGVTCRVYHSDCLEWDSEVSKKGIGQLEFGWRCLRCRVNLRTAKGGCDAMHER